jgi:hypothetical protein
LRTDVDNTDGHRDVKVVRFADTSVDHIERDLGA